MKRARHLFAALALAVVALAATDAKLPYFSNVRDVTVNAPDRQNYMVPDAEVWRYSRPDLADLRLYSGETIVPYAMTIERASSNTAQMAVRTINRGTVKGATQFVLDVTGTTEYDSVTLNVGRKDFLTHATIEGADTLPSDNWTKLATATIFDFSRERLGNNFTVRLPLSRFRYLRVSIADSVSPQDVVGATVATREEHKPSWTDVPATVEVSNELRRTTYTFHLGGYMPVENVHFEVPANFVNFRRQATVLDTEERTLAAGPVTRVRIKRGTDTAENESLDIDVPVAASDWKTYKVVIDNGDDPPLPLTSVKLRAAERRLYFDPRGPAALKLYYGDMKLEPPVFEYAALIHADPNAAVASLGSPQHNQTYSGRPDQRPWTERNPWVMWGALVVAVLGLGAVALRSFRGA